MAYTYRKYKKGVKKLGAKQVATPVEFKLIQKRMQKRYGKTLRTSSIEKSLRKAGLTEKEIARLRGK